MSFATAVLAFPSDAAAGALSKEESVMRRTKVSQRTPYLRARLGVERFEDRVPVSESVGPGLTLRALAGAASAQSSQTFPPPPELCILTRDKIGWHAPSSQRARLARSRPSRTQSVAHG